MDDAVWDSLIAESGNGPKNPFSDIVQFLDKTRALTVYIRKSGLSAEESQGFYLLAQHDIPRLLVEAGFPADKIIPLDEDTGISAWLGRLHRPDLQRQHEMIMSGQVGTVVALEVSRLFRDEYLTAPVEFAKITAYKNTSVVAQIGGKMRRLDLKDPNDHALFINECAAAAHHRKKLAHQLRSAREESARQGNYVGGPIPFGWAVKSGVKRGQSKTGHSIPPQMYVYPQHKEYRLEVWRRAILPQIETYPDLLRDLRENNLYIPPFDEKTAEECLHKHCLRSKTTFCRGIHWFPSLDTLSRILLDPLAVGFRLYGSGPSAVTYKRRLEGLAESQMQQADTEVRLEKECFGYFSNLALWAGGTAQEAEDIRTLFLAVQRKWNPLDFETLARSGWRERTPNPHQTAGKPHLKRHRFGARNHWAQRVLCLHHEPASAADPCTYPMAVHSGGEAWECYRERARGIRRGACSQWGDKNRLGRIIDLHLHRMLRDTLQGKTLAIRSAGEQGLAQALLAQKVKERGLLQREYDNALKTVVEIQTPSDSSEEEPAVADMLDAEVRAQVAQYRQEHVMPALKKLATVKAEVARLEAEAAEVHARDGLCEGVAQHLDRVLGGWNALTVAERVEAVQTFAARIGVWVGDGVESREALVRFDWKHGERHYLISWRSAWQDRRTWTGEEDQALQELWATSASWEEIRQRLQPGRKFVSAYNHAWQTGAAKRSGRPMAWYEEQKKADRSFGDQHPDILYLHYRPSSPHTCQAIRHDGSASQIALPNSVRRFLLGCEERGLMQVTGIGPKKFAKIAPFVRLD